MTNMNNANPLPILDLYIQRDSTDTFVPSNEAITEWVSTTLTGRRSAAELAIAMVDEKTMQDYNLRFRHKDKPTNILSFPAQIPDGVKTTLLGDILLCPNRILQEANHQKTTAITHFAHLIVHGTLHLLGYDHEEDEEARIMEQEEIQILTHLGFANPYE